MDDLPSYEDMIVEVLVTLGEDSDGIAPKDLYTQMAARYPVQANFRPSAAQALQKAFRKGRFEKSESGRYRLNPEWKGGTTTRRNTRRPQVHGNTTPAPSGAPAPTPVHAPQIARPPPFTKAPLVRNGSAPPSGRSTTGWYTASKQRSRSIAMNATGQGTSTANPTVGSGGFEDPFEAAQHILKTINFGNELLRMESDHEGGGRDSSVPLHNIAPERGAGMEMRAALFGSGSGELGFDQSARAELQAQLALLAVQLNEILHEPTIPHSEPGLPPQTHEAPEPVMEDAISGGPLPLPPQQAPVSGRSEELDIPMMEDDSDDEDMDEVIV